MTRMLRMLTDFDLSKQSVFIRLIHVISVPIPPEKISPNILRNQKVSYICNRLVT